MNHIEIKFIPKQFKQLEPILNKQIELAKTDETGLAVGNILFVDKTGFPTLKGKKAILKVGLVSKEDGRNYKKEIDGKFLQLGDLEKEDNGG